MVKKVDYESKPAEPGITPGPENSAGYKFSKNNDDESCNDDLNKDINGSRDLPVDFFFEVIPCGTHYCRDLQAEKNQKNIESNKRCPEESNR